MTTANIVITCNAAAHTSSLNMDLGSIALGIPESDVIQAQKMAHVLGKAYILTWRKNPMNLTGTKLEGTWTEGIKYGE